MQTVLTAIASVRPAVVQAYQNLAVVPLVRQNGHQGLECLVLEEAEQRGLTIVETKLVEELDVENNTGQDVVLIAGEIITGGAQNRMVAANAYVAAGYNGKIPVRCVEQHRWDRSRGSRFSGHGGHAPTTIVGAAHDQREVWRNVNETLTLTSLHSLTGDLTTLYGQKDGELADTASHFRLLPNQVGIVAVMGFEDGKKFALDLFDSPEIMRRHYGKLLQARAAEAMTYGPKTLRVEMPEVALFLNDLKNAQFTERSRISAGTDYTLTAPGSEGSALIRGDTVVYVSAVSRQL